MTTESGMPDLRTRWQHLPSAEARPISLADVHARARALERKFRRTDAIIYACGVVNVASFAAVMWFLPGLRLVAGFVIVTAIVIVVQYHRRRPMRAGDPVLASDACLDYYRGSLERQRDLSRRIGRWFFPPALPGQAALMAGFLIAPPGVPRRWIWIALPFWLLVDVVIFAGAWRRHRKEAARAQRELDDLERLA
jgi:hypothetical protein